jgi:hypothetical protein
VALVVAMARGVKLANPNGAKHLHGFRTVMAVTSLMNAKVADLKRHRRFSPDSM